MFTRHSRERTAHWAQLVLMWCAWLNIGYDELDPDTKILVHDLATRVIDEDLPGIAAAAYGVPR